MIFFWITDGIGWKTTERSLREAFEHNDYIFNLSMLEKRHFRISNKIEYDFKNSNSPPHPSWSFLSYTTNLRVMTIYNTVIVH